MIQRLFATALSLQGLAPRLGDDLVRERLERAVDDLDETVRESRRTIFSMRQDEGLDGGVRAALHEHADAGRVSVAVATDGTSVAVEVADDGRGFAGTHRRSGLANLEQRAARRGKLGLGSRTQAALYLRERADPELG